MYEVEIKIELHEAEREQLITACGRYGFASKGVTPQRDYYIAAVESPHGGYDLERYRDEDGFFLYTKKSWEVVDGYPCRKEDQHEVSVEEFERQVAAHPDALKIIKDREWFAGTYKEIPISLTIDSVTFDHSPGVRYFTEVEIGVEDSAAVKETKAFLQQFLQEILQREIITESPGMFTMAFKKL
ncbi:MAG: hypothetical protein RL150_126 [Candidatus Parcubacteria bacterium]|jgi:adenylate cyclase class IV